MTCRQDVVELLDKRVRSRFSSRTIIVHGPHGELSADMVPPLLVVTLPMPTHPLFVRFGTTVLHWQAMH